MGSLMVGGGLEPLSGFERASRSPERAVRCSKAVEVTSRIDAIGLDLWSTARDVEQPGLRAGVVGQCA